MKKRFGFTLAEVLITLGIIGVVAAMTIPNLIANTNSAKFSSQFKKTLATLNQAALMAQAQYDINFASLDTSTDGVLEHPEHKSSLGALLNGTLSGGTLYTNMDDLTLDKSGSSVKYVDSVSLVTDFIDNQMDRAYIMADGSMFVFASDAKACTIQRGLNDDNTDMISLKALECYGYIDVNGLSLPNKEVSCSYTTDANTGKGTASVNPSSACVIKKGDSRAVTDIFPVVFHDGTVEPATNAAKAILTQGK